MQKACKFRRHFLDARSVLCTLEGEWYEQLSVKKTSTNAIQCVLNNSYSNPNSNIKYLAGAAIAGLTSTIIACEGDNQEKQRLHSWLGRSKLYEEYNKKKDIHSNRLNAGIATKQTLQENNQSFHVHPSDSKHKNDGKDTVDIASSKFRNDPNAHPAKEPRQSSNHPTPNDESGETPGQPRDDLPFYTLKDVEAHSSISTGVWVTFAHGVYDITHFVRQHPGGSSKIMLAAGKSVEPFWSLYSQHKKTEIYKILEDMRIGSLDPVDMDKMRQSNLQTSGDSLYANEPPRHPALIMNAKVPCNAEPPANLVADTLITPNDLFFVRNHLPVPVVDVHNYRLEIYVPGKKEPVKLTLEDIKSKFKPVTIMATLQCAGNRRHELNSVRKVKGLSWGTTAISNATWTGARLRDILIYAGVDPDAYQIFDHPLATKTVKSDDTTIRHICFEGLDTDPEGTGYEASIPVTKAMSPTGDVVLAYEMNGGEIPRDHGFPLRAVVPGHVGARNVKWLAKIIASPVESHGHHQQKDYKSFSPSTTWETVDWESAPAIQEAPVTSAICEPSPGASFDVEDGSIPVRGYAWSGGGRTIIRVDVSTNGGETWTTAELHPEASRQPHGKAWAWVPWNVDIPIPSHVIEEMNQNPGSTKRIELCCRAVDSSYNTQPDATSSSWNIRGVLNNAWHRIPVMIVPPEEDDER